MIPKKPRFLEYHGSLPGLNHMTAREKKHTSSVSYITEQFGPNHEAHSYRRALSGTIGRPVLCLIPQTSKVFFRED